MKQIAHFFWHGKLSLYEQRCINSFVFHNFDVRVWSYEQIDIPIGARLFKASEILPISELNTFKVWNSKTNQYEHHGGINSGFSDLFRFNLLMKHDGWWFDTDVVCLRDESDFKTLLNNKQIVVGKEDDTYTNGAILNFPSRSINQLALNKCIEICNNSREFEWGVVGPKLITNFVKENNLEKEVYDRLTFYPLRYDELDYFFQPHLKQRAEEVSKNSYTTHLWNWNIIKTGIDKNIPPHKDSYLYSIFYKD